jgi:AP endonuclease-1
VSYNEDRHDSDDSDVKPAKKTGRVNSKAPAKRKAESEPEEPAAKAPAKPAPAPAPKKRKTKAKDEDNAMPLAERTAVSSLKKAMYIGAHVSAAGGSPSPISPISHESNLLLKLVS